MNNRNEHQRAYPSYLTGENGTVTSYSNYPSHAQHSLDIMLRTNNQDVLILTKEESIAVLNSWGWQPVKNGWVKVTQSPIGNTAINYGTNAVDVVTTSMIIAKFGELGIKGRIYLNRAGNEVITFTGRTGVRKIFNAPTYLLKHVKVVDMGIGKYGLKNNVINGARLTFYVAAAYRILDYILNDSVTLTQFIGSLGTDIVKIGIASGVSWVVGTVVAASIPIIAVQLIVVVAVSFGTAYALNLLDNKFGITDKVVAHLNNAQQALIGTRDIIRKDVHSGLIDIGQMMAVDAINTGRQMIEAEFRHYIKSSFTELRSRIL